MTEIVREELGDAGTWEKLSPTATTGVTDNIRKPQSGIHKGMEAKAMIIVVETHSIRVKLNGDDATASNGILINAGQNYTILGINNVKNFQCMDSSGASAVHLIPFF